MTEFQLRSDIPVELVTHQASDALVVAAARVSTKGVGSEVPEGDLDEYRGLIGFLMKNRHGSPFEHSYFCWMVSAPIFVWREHMRHRIASYNEESGRYKQLDPVFYTPGPDRRLVQEGRAGAYEFVPGSDSQRNTVELVIDHASYEAYTSYQAMLDAGVAREVARAVLPVNIYSSAFVSMNARALMNFLSLRTKSPDSAFPSFPQREIEMVAEQYEEDFARLMPLTYQAFVDNGRVAP